MWPNFLSQIKSLLVKQQLTLASRFDLNNSDYWITWPNKLVVSILGFCVNGHQSNRRSKDSINPDSLPNRKRWIKKKIEIFQGTFRFFIQTSSASSLHRFNSGLFRSADELQSERQKGLLSFLNLRQWWWHKWQSCGVVSRHPSSIPLCAGLFSLSINQWQVLKQVTHGGAMLTDFLKK